ncbi:unnamed protein product [Sphagnum troendelagicum]
MARGTSSDERTTTHKREGSRDMYGFEVRPQHLERYLEYAAIYKEEEAQRSEQWTLFLSTHNEGEAVGAQAQETNVSSEGEYVTRADREQGRAAGLAVEAWGQLRSSLWPVEQALKRRRKKVATTGLANADTGKVEHVAVTRIGSSGDEYHEEFGDGIQGGSHESGENAASGAQALWDKELEFLVQRGVPMALRGELWQVFVGAKERRVPGHYNALLTLLADGGGDSNGVGGLCVGSNTANYEISNNSRILEKWTSQIEKDLPRTFPGHPSLDEDGRNILRRLLTAYARHNPSVGYCQAMNFLAALLLLLMPEENAFWSLTGIIDDYFEGYYSENLVEAQVDQLVFEQLVREHFPKLVTHLDNLGVQVAWVCGPWFLSIFVNVLPWESVLRVWDVLLFEGNRTMLFRTALALVEVHAGALMQQRDAGDAVALLQTMAGATFDSSQLILTACLGFQSIDETQLLALRSQHRPGVLLALHERSLEVRAWRASSGFSSNNGLSNGKTDDDMLPSATKKLSNRSTKQVNSPEVEESFSGDIQEQVKWLKSELCRALEDKKAAELRADELEIALMEMVKEDNRRLLSAKLEELEAEVALLRQQLEQIQALNAEKLEKAADALSSMEKRAVMAESMLEVTILSQETANSKAHGTVRSTQDDRPQEGIYRSHSSPSPMQDTKPPHGRRGRSIDVSDVVDYSKLSNGNADTTSSLKEPVTRRQGMFARFSH